MIENGRGQADIAHDASGMVENAARCAPSHVRERFERHHRRSKRVRKGFSFCRLLSGAMQNTQLDKRQMRAYGDPREHLRQRRGLTSWRSSGQERRQGRCDPPQQCLQQSDQKHTRGQPPTTKTERHCTSEDDAGIPRRRKRTTRFAG